MATLTPGAISQLFAGTQNLSVTVQVIDITMIKSDTGNDRYRLILSDGQHYIQAMLATQNNQLVQSKVLDKFTVIRLTDYSVNDVAGRKLVICLTLEVLNQQPAAIGSPNNVERAMAAGAAAAPAAPTAAAAAPAAAAVPPAAPRMGTAAGAGAGAANRNLHPIESLNPYQNRWTIKARVTQKSDIRTWNKPLPSGGTNSGKLFSVTLLDDKGGEIRATFFKDAVDQFYDMIQEQGVYFFSGGKVKVANKRFTSCKHEYELMFDPGADISPAPEDNSIGMVSFDFTPIAELEGKAPDTMVDVLGVVTAYSECQDLTSKAGKPYTKRDLTLVDQSGCEIRITLWNDQARVADDQLQNNTIAAFKGAKLSDYNGRTLGTYGSTTILYNPEIPEAQALYDWFQAQGGSVQARTLSSGGGGGGGGGMGTFTERALVGHIKEKTLGYGDKPDYITVRATIQNIYDQNCWYPACPADGCNKKLVQDVSGQWMCAKCDRGYPKYTNRYILSVRLFDHSALTFATLFDEEARKLLDGRSADEMEELQTNDAAAFGAVLQASNLTSHLFRLRVKASEYNGETRVKAQVVGFEPIDHVQECRDLLAAIQAF